MKVWAGFIRFRIGTTCGLLWSRSWILSCRI